MQFSQAFPERMRTAVPLQITRRTHLALFLMVVACGISAGRAQTADVTHWTSGYSMIDQAWRFHAGDDPQWAMPGFDDSQWSLFQIDRSWAKQGYRAYSGYAWYRIQLRLPANGPPLALLLYPPASSVEVYVDGRLAATIGRMRPAPQWRMLSAVPQVVLLPHLGGTRTAEVAMRVWESPLAASSAGAGSARLPLVGSADAIRELHALAFNRLLIQQLPGVLPLVVSTVIGLFTLALFLIRLRAREYLWGALWLLSGPAQFALDMLRQSQQWPMSPSVLALETIRALGLVFWLLLIWRFVGSGNDWKLKIGLSAIALLPIAVVLVMMGAIPVAGDYIFSLAVSLALGILILVHLLQLALRGRRDAQIFLAPFLLFTAMGAVDDLRGALYFLGIITPVNAKSESIALYQSAAFTVTGQQFFSLLSYLALAVVLILRFARSAREEQRLATELQSARQLQSHLVPAALAPTAHLRFDAAYCAASEVGGDFYQVFPAEDGSALVAIGDVSGKGLRAAMFATLVVGALRSLARLELPPSQILSRLNEQLAEPETARFVTCMVLRISNDGHIAIANAGHLPPYRNGREIEIDSGLPLGISLDAGYAENELDLAPGDTLTLLSDGVVEAQDGNGELFGFERTCAISTQPAAAIAEAAQIFGQQDDITVLRIGFVAAPELEAHAARL